MTVVTRVTLVAGGDAGARERAIANRLPALEQAGASLAVILEGGSEISGLFDSAIPVTRLSPACPCCVGNLAMRVTLNRILRNPPSQLFISIAQAAHLEAVRDALMQAPYDQHLTLTENLIV
ncbi:MAG: GTPase [Oxalobacter sp.]|nr:MAG: GTPase [Oxalobacter sp.]